MDAVSDEDAAAFVAKVRGAWPEWNVVDGFIPAADRPRVEAWQALQFELQEAAWGGSDARPGEAKLAWWGEELLGWGQARRRHPLGVELLRASAPWAALAGALPMLAQSRERPHTSDEAWTQLSHVAEAVNAVEASLLGRPGDPQAIAVCWLAARLARHPASAVPLDRRDAADWASHLLARAPRRVAGHRARRVEFALARSRLRAANPSLPRSPLAALWNGWRAARD